MVKTFTKRDLSEMVAKGTNTSARLTEKIIKATFASLRDVMAEASQEV